MPLFVPFVAHLRVLLHIQAFMELYSQILDNGGPAFGTILRHVRDHPEKGCVFHCTGIRTSSSPAVQGLISCRSWQGQNRCHCRTVTEGELAPQCLMVSGLTAYKLAGVDDETIAEDYALTRVGREPARAMVMARLAKVPLFAANHEAALNMLTSRYVHSLPYGHFGC